jgi:hypothetical protein
VFLKTANDRFVSSPLRLAGSVGPDVDHPDGFFEPHEAEQHRLRIVGFESA